MMADDKFYWQALSTEQLDWLSEHYYEINDDALLFRPGRWSELDYYNSAPNAVILLLHEVERLRAREAALVEIAEAVVANGHKALRGHNFDCWYCGNQPFKQFEPGGVIEAGWEHAPDCPVTKARALLAEGEGQ